MRRLLAHVKGWQWRPDMIWFDNLNCVRTASYYVQQLYSHNKGSHVLSLTMNQKPAIGAENQNGLFASAVWENETRTIIMKVANTSGEKQAIALNFSRLKKREIIKDGTCIQLHSHNSDADNTLEQPSVIFLQESRIIDKNCFRTELEANTFAVYRFEVIII
jgi:alpha-L-arabinofuranosidase